MLKRLLPICLMGLTSLALAIGDRDKYYEDASRLFFEKDYKGTLIQLKNALQTDPEHVPSLLLAGKTYLQLGQPAAAEESLIMARVMGADKSVVNLTLAKSYIEQVKYQSVIDELSAQGLADTEKAEMLGYIARAWLGLENIPEAAATIAEADAINPEALRPNLARILLLITTDKLNQALDTSQRLVQAYPDESEVWNSLASVFHAMGNIATASKHYQKSLQLDADNIDARIALIGLLSSLEDYEETLPHLDYLAEHFPFEPRAAYFRALSWSKLASADNDYREKSPLEMRKCVEIIAQLPSESVTRDQQISMIATLAHYSLGEFEASKEYLSHFLKKFPYDPRANRLMGDILLRLNDPIAAIRVLRPTAQSYPNEPKLTTLLALAYSRVGQHERATQLLEDLESSGNANKTSRELLGINLLQSGYLDAGIEALSESFDSNPNQSSTGFTLSVAMLKDGRHSKAIETALQLVSQDNNPSNRNLLGITYRSAGELQKAHEIFSSITREYPELIPPQINLAKTEEALGQIQNSYDRLSQMNSQYPENTSILLALAQLEFRRGNISDAINLAEKAKQLDSKNFNIRELLVKLYLSTGDKISAENLAAGTMLIDQNGFQSSSLMAQVYLATGRPRKAASIYKRMSKEAGFNTEKLYKIAQFQQQAQAWEAARHTLYKALEGSPSHIPSKIGYIQIQLRLNEFNDALKHSLELLKWYPQDSFAHLLTGDAYSKLGKLTEAENYYSKGLALKPHPLLLTGLYRTLMAQDKVQQAGELAKQYWNSHSNQPVVGEVYSQYLMFQGKWGQAKEILLSMEANQQDNPITLNNLAYTLYRLGDQSALLYAQKAYHLAPDNPIINDTLGWLLTENERADEGLRYLRQAIARASGNNEIRYHLATALYRLNRIEESKSELEKALAAGESFPGIEDAQQALKEMKQ